MKIPARDQDRRPRVRERGSGRRRWASLAAALHSGVSEALSSPPDRSGARPASIIGGVAVALIVGMAVLRELIFPGANLIGGVVDLLDARYPYPNLWRPAGLLVAIVSDLVLLTVLTRALERRGVGVVWQVAAGSVLSMAIATLFAISVKPAIHHWHWAVIGKSLISGPIGGMQVYALWVLAFRYPKVIDDARLRALEADRLRRAAELSRLREHLQPHFLRNTLNAIAASVRHDPDEARDLLAVLGDLLSDSLDDDRPTQTLAEETAWLRRYTEIFAIRHRGALRFTWDLDPAAAAIELPRLLLQPLVENAVRHGALANVDGGEVRIATRRTREGVTVVVEDDGPGVAAGCPEGLGLHLVRRRLAIECHDASLHISSSGSGPGSGSGSGSGPGTRAVVELR